MSERSRSLALRRAALVERCRLQRDQMEVRQLEIRQSLRSFGGIALFAARTRKNPLPLAGLLLGLIAVRPQRLLKMAASVLAIRKAWQTLAPVVAPLVQRLRN